MDGETVRLTGPALTHRIINQNVLPNKVCASSNAQKVTVFAYTNTDQTDYRIIVLNKWEATTLNFSVPNQIMFHAYIPGMDTFALGLIKSAMRPYRCVHRGTLRFLQDRHRC